ncbi:MAG: GNAT family N-acetyltransferase [Actinomycetota bacterium]
MTISLRPLTLADADACDAIMVGLPYHFGHEEGRSDCAAAVRTQRGLVAELDGEVLGFLTFRTWFEDAAEITWMAVRAAHRNAGVGRSLMDRLAADLGAGAGDYCWCSPPRRTTHRTRSMMATRPRAPSTPRTDSRSHATSGDPGVAATRRC